MKLNEITFMENVTYNDMLDMAQMVVESICGDPDKRLTMLLGKEFLYLQGAARLFTTYGTRDTDGNIEDFMNTVFGMGVERFEQWLSDGAGKEKYEAFKRMVERGCEYYLDKSGVELLMGAATSALNAVTDTLKKFDGADEEMVSKIASALQTVMESDGGEHEE